MYRSMSFCCSTFDRIQSDNQATATFSLLLFLSVNIMKGFNKVLVQYLNCVKKYVTLFVVQEVFYELNDIHNSVATP